MTKCPICGAEYEEGTVKFCKVCMYSIGTDVYLTNLLNQPSEEDLVKYNQSLEEYRALWYERKEEQRKIEEARLRLECFEKKSDQAKRENLRKEEEKQRRIEEEKRRKDEKQEIEDVRLQNEFLRKGQEEQIAKAKAKKRIWIVVISMTVLSMAMVILIYYQAGFPGLSDLLHLKKDESEIEEKFVFVEGGTFTMGATPEQGSQVAENEKPIHEVTVGDFIMGKTELTLGEFEEFIEATGYKTSAEIFEGSLIWFGSDDFRIVEGVNWSCDPNGKKRHLSEKNYPVIHVSWYDAVVYCNWKSKKEQLIPAYSLKKDINAQGNQNEVENQNWLVICDFNSNGYRLPTEAEWEFAARGGNKSKSSKYSGSNELGEVAWYGAIANSGNRTREDGTSEVGKKQPNELGLFDMNGNVSEWVWNFLEDYSPVSDTNPRGPGEGLVRIIRGGSWKDEAKDCRISGRSYFVPTNGTGSYGFRIVRTKK